MGGAVVYALGGGAGHLARATVYASRFCGGEEAVTIVYSAGAPRVVTPPPRARLVAIPAGARPGEVRDLLAGELGPGRRRELVVDAFPGGLGWEIDDALVASASRSTLIRRYVKPLAYEGYEPLAARYDRFVLPYAPDRCEWPEEDVCRDAGVFSGPLIRALPVLPGRPATLAVVGDASRLSAGVRQLLPGDTTHACGTFAALPPARAYLATSAGYHVTYELDRLGVPYGLVPEEKRYDDQFRRADLLGRFIRTTGDLEALLAEAA